MTPVSSKRESSGNSNTNIKIHINFEFCDHPTGGTNQFLKALRKGLRDKGVYAESPDQADILLFNSYQFIAGVLHVKKRNPDVLVAHRIDGPIRLYNPPKDPRDGILYLANRVLADCTIFQSEWSRKENYRLGLKPAPYEAVIPNSVDPLIFHDVGKISFSRSRKVKIIASSWSPNWQKGFETYKWLDEHLQFTQYDMTFVGNSPLTFKNIKHLPPMNSQDLANEMRANDIFIFASPVEACSNTLSEALHCRLPVIVKKGSSNGEILRDGGEVFETNEQIPEILEKLVANYELYQDRIRVYSLDNIVEQYYLLLYKLYNDRESSVYESKKLKIIPEATLRCALSWWKLQGRVRRHLK